MPPGSTVASLVCTCVWVPIDRRHAAVQQPPHRDLLAGRLGVEVEDHDRSLASRLLGQLEGDVERADRGVEEQLAQQVDNGHLRAVGGRRRRHAAPRRAVGVVGRADDARLRPQVRVDLALPERVVAQRDQVDPGGQQPVGQPAGDAHPSAAFSALAMTMSISRSARRRGQPLLDHAPAGRREDVCDEQDPHALDQARAAARRRGRGQSSIATWLPASDVYLATVWEITWDRSTTVPSVRPRRRHLAPDPHGRRARECC